MPNDAAREMPRYRSHKTVHALKIKSIDTDAATNITTITPVEDGYLPFEVDAAYVKKHRPRAGGYYVVYPDGYKSWSPATSFESGYDRLD